METGAGAGWQLSPGTRPTRTRRPKISQSKPVPGPHQVYGFLTTAPNAVVEPIHPEGDAGDPDDRRGARCLDARVVG